MECHFRVLKVAHLVIESGVPVDVDGRTLCGVSF